MLSDIVESLGSSISDPYEVITSEDMLSRVEVFNEEIEKEKLKKEKKWECMGLEIRMAVNRV